MLLMVHLVLFFHVDLKWSNLISNKTSQLNCRSLKLTDGKILLQFPAKQRNNSSVVCIEWIGDFIPKLRIVKCKIARAPLVSGTFLTRTRTQGEVANNWLKHCKGGKKASHFKVCARQPDFVEPAQWAFAPYSRAYLKTLFSFLWKIVFKSFPPDSSLGTYLFKTFKEPQPTAVLPVGQAPARAEDSYRVRLQLVAFIIPEACIPSVSRALWETKYILESTSGKSGMFLGEKAKSSQPLRVWVSTPLLS